MNEPTAVLLDGLSGPLRVLQLLVVDFGHLPAPYASVSPVYPDVLSLRLHDDLGVFELWRDALGIPGEAVSCGVQSAGSVRVLEARGEYAGTVVELTGFSEIPAPVLVGGAA
ncbi:hypothetical protein SSP531S_56470 [Streptomyces spongiicola]|uniref:Uncharacterized protein n=1 Tax=Streptomyces spongiicola TaxID=1690221 RepID=A0A388T925_9ACTN|nr:hypothetical protein [Streptomyces spongiicola]GBQ04155.1 hypothetical protein SSP531S_56470 [Streptomyces spongiicola]